MQMPNDPNLATIWEGVADAIPGQPALFHGDRTIAWGAFENRAARLAQAFLDAGLGPGSKIAIDMYNCSQWLEAFFAGIKIRAVPTNVNYRYRDQELRHLLVDSHAEALLLHRSLAERMLPVAHSLGLKLIVEVEDEPGPVSPGTCAFEALIDSHAPAARIERSGEDQFLSYTGGTTGLPKGVMVRLGSAVNSVSFVGPMLGLTPQMLPDHVGTARELAARDARVSALPASPLMHSTGFQMTALPALTYGGAVATLVSRSLDARELLAVVERHRVRQVAIVGDAIGRPLVNALREDAAAGRRYDLSCLKLISSAGVAFTAETKIGLFEFIPDVTLLDACGTSEGITYGFRAYRKGDPLSGTNFTPAPGLLLLDEQGNARPATPGLTGIMANTTGAAGYYNDPEKTARTYRMLDGRWCAVPGDHGRIEADGTLTLLGRGSTTINTGGEKVHPEEVEDVIKGLTQVEDCLVIGLPDERWGQRVTAIVQPRAGARLDAEAVIAHVRAQLAPYKAPKAVVTVARVPRAPNGKPDYRGAADLARQSRS
ncbi:MAG: AMP-binding protein [Gammaproteobacteria bacterium]